MEGRRLVRRLNIEGDGQGDLAGHGGEHRAVLVYQVDSYRYWAEHLGRPDLTYGQFGENFTVDGLPDDEVCIGDRYRIGEAVFEVSQPRVTCYRLGIRMDEPQMAALLVSHRRPGFYLRVLTEGHVEAGDEVIKVSSPPESVTVAEVDALLYLHEHPREQLARALRVDALSPGWKASLRALLEQADGGQATGGNVGLTAAAGSPPPAWPGFRPLTITAVHHETSSVMSLRLVAARRRRPPDPAAGAVPDRAPGHRFRRDRRAELLPLGATERRGLPDQRQAGAGGIASRHLHGAAAPGQTIEAAVPAAPSPWHQDPTRSLPVSAGVGVTPVLAMLYAVVAEGSNRPVWWVHGARNGSEHPFAAEARGLLAQAARARSLICYSSPSADDRLDDPVVRVGHVTADVIAGLGLPTTLTCTCVVRRASWPI